MTPTHPHSRFDDFVSILRRLRKECPWDREQTPQSIRHSLIEETYEVVDAIDRNDAAGLKSELGDLLLHVVFQSVMAEETGSFTIDNVLETVSEKLIRRHPHVFGGSTAGTASEVKANWERLKLNEGRTSVVDGVPRELPSLLRATRVQEKVSRFGFDWKEKREVWDKVSEEIEELREAERGGEPGPIEEEFGDLLFSLVNYSRFIGVNAEFALAGAIEKFVTRFRKVEEELEQKGSGIQHSTLEEMDAIWNRHKRPSP